MSRAWAILLTGWVWLGFPQAVPGAPDPTPRLVAVLQSDASVEEKANACRKLGEMGTDEAVPVLADLLDHGLLATYARSALERIPGSAARAALRSALDSTQAGLLVGVINSLGTLRDEKAVDGLRELASRDDGPVARAALLALGRVATPEAVQAVRSALMSGREGAGGAALLAAEQQLARGDEAAAVALFDAVRSADVPQALRLGATRGAILARRSVPFLMEQLGAEDDSVRDVALLVMREMPSDSLAEALHHRLATAAPDLRVQLIAALADCHNDDSFPVVRSQLGSVDPGIRMAALGAVEAVGRGPELAAALLDVAQGPGSPEERQMAVGMLTRMEGGPEVDRLILHRLRTSGAVDARIDVLRVVAERKVEGALPDLLEQARDPDPRVRGAAFRAMRRLAGPLQVPPLINLIASEKNGSARTSAIQTLVRACGDDGPSGERILAELERESPGAQRDVWIGVLIAVGYTDALPTILEGLESDDDEMVATTITHLSRWPGPAPIAALLPLIEGDASGDVRRRAVAAVIQLTTTAADRGQASDDVLVGWFGRAHRAVETVDEKRQLISGLGRVHTLGSLRLLAPYLHDPEVQVEALYALLAIGPPLVKGGQAAAVGEALPEDPAVGDPDLRSRLERLRERVDTARSAP